MPSFATIPTVSQKRTLAVRSRLKHVFQISISEKPTGNDAISSMKTAMMAQTPSAPPIFPEVDIRLDMALSLIGSP